MRHGDASDFREWRQGAYGADRPAVEQAARLHLVPKLRHDVLAGGSLFRDLHVILFHPVNEATGARAPGLHARSARKDDHHVLPERLLILLNAVAEAFSRRNHDGDRDHAPGDPEHREQRAPLVRPERGQRVRQQITKGHGMRPLGPASAAPTGG